MNRSRHTVLNSDTDILIWERLFKVRVPHLQSRTLEDIADTGVVLSGVPEIDRDIPNQWLTTYMSIATMVGYYKETVPMKVVEYNDCKTIYELVSKHIYTWKHVLDTGLNIGDSPIEDLITLDQFANAVYDKAKYIIPKEDINPGISKQLAAVTKINTGNFFNSSYVNPMNNPTKQEPTIQDRNELGDFFKNKLAYIRRY